MVDIEEHREDARKLTADIYTLIFERSKAIRGGITDAEIATILEIVKSLFITDEPPTNIIAVLGKTDELGINPSDN